VSSRLHTFIDAPGHANHDGRVCDERTAGFSTGDTFGISHRALETPP